MIDLEKMTTAVGELEEEKVLEMLNNFIDTNPSEEEAQQAVSACQKGMAIVGDLFEKGEYFVGDLIFAGELLTDAINVLKPVIGGGASKKVGAIVLGTVHGDLHDIGIDRPVSAFVDKVKGVKPDIVGMSGVLTLALEAMKNTVDGLRQAGIRDNIKIIIGGNPVTKEACNHFEADASTTNTAEGLKISQGWVN